MAKKHFRVKPYKHLRLKFVVRSKVTGKWERRFFQTKAEAETYAQQKEIELLNQGVEAMAFSTDLRIMAQRAAGQSAQHKKTIADAAAFYLKHLEATEHSVKVSQALAELLENRRGEGLSKRYCQEVELRLRRFARDFSGRLVSTITTAEIDHWLAALNLAPVTRNTFRRDLKTLFSFCITRRYCVSNPATDTRKAKEVDREAGILSVAETARLLEAADDMALPYVAIGAFAGVRAAELHRLHWEEIHWDSKLIEVKASKSKTARRRFIKLQPNLEKWLAPYRNKRGAICPVGFRKRTEAARLRAKIRSWPSNALRHGFASYHLAHFKNANELALEMGHADAEMIFRHYRELVQPKEAARYWQITPAEREDGKVISLSDKLSTAQRRM